MPLYVKMYNVANLKAFLGLGMSGQIRFVQQYLNMVVQIHNKNLSLYEKTPCTQNDSNNINNNSF